LVILGFISQVLFYLSLPSVLIIIRSPTNKNKKKLRIEPGGRSLINFTPSSRVLNYCSFVRCVSAARVPLHVLRGARKDLRGGVYCIYLYVFACSLITVIYPESKGRKQNPSFKNKEHWDRSFSLPLDRN
jgi:hypothetical protein